MSWNQILTNRQLEIAKDLKEKKPRHIILEGAIRSGKTVLGIIFWYSLLTRNDSKGKLFIMTGQTISSLKRNVLDEMTKFFGVDTHLNLNNEFMLNDAKVACFGSDKSDSYKTMHGLTASGWYANEITLSHINSVLEGFARCSDKNSKIIWETNPDKATHFIKTDYINNSGSCFDNGKHNICSYHFKVGDNTFLDRNYVESLKQSIPQGVYYDRMINGLWKVSDRQVFRNFDVVAAPPSERDIDYYCYGLDFGWTNPTALVRIMLVDNEIYIQGLLYESELKTEHLVLKLKGLIFDKNSDIICDIDNDKIRTLRDAGFNCKAADKGKGSVLAGINKMRQYKLHLVNTDANLVHEFENYENCTNAQGDILEEPIKMNDHYVDAARYAIMSLRRGRKNADVGNFVEIGNEFKF